MYRHLCLSFFASISILFSFPYELNAQLHLDLSENTNLTFLQIVDSVESYYEVMGKDKGKGYKIYQRWKYENERSLDSSGRIVNRKTQAKIYENFLSKQKKTKHLDVTFEELGPLTQTNTATWSSSLGRISAIGLDSKDSTHIIVGSPSGGIWKTNNRGTSWKAVYDYATNIDILSLCISHADSNMYWAGTSDKIIHSGDGGKNWHHVINGPTGRINTIIMDPSNSKVLLSSERWGGKIHRSADGGVTWTEVYNGNRAYDIEFHPNNSDTIYASGQGYIVRSVDNGLTWTTINGGPWTNTGVIMLAVSKNAPDYVYALQESSGGYNGTFRSMDKGATWVTQSDNSSGENNILTYEQESQGGQAPRDMDIVVSPDDKDKIYVAGTELWSSTDGGVNFDKIADWLVDSELPFIHADVDIMYYTDHGLYAGTDGGIFISTNGGDTFKDHTPGIGVRQFYRIGASQTVTDMVSGGSQDNGTGVLVNGVWKDYLGADGMETFIDWSNANIMYGNVQNGQLWKSTDGGNNRIFVSQVGGEGAWVTPTEQDPMNANTIYHGKGEIYKSTNGAISWDTISNLQIGENCNEIEIASSNNQVIYASWGSLLYKTVNGGASWTNISPNGNWINYIDSHPTDPNRIMIAQHSKIYESTNGGTSWNDISQNLPAITYNCVLYQGDATDGIYAGGRYGIWHKDNSTNTQWLNQSGNMPIAQVTELEIRNNVMYVATYGRGLWKTNLSTDEGISCSKAIELNMPGTFTASGPLYGNGCHNCDNSQHANWYKFTPPLTGKVNIESCISGVDTRLFVYSGNCNTLMQIGISDNDCMHELGSSTTLASQIKDLAVTAGTPIYIEWDNRWSNSSFFWSIKYEDADCPNNLTGTSTLSNKHYYSREYKAQNGISSSQNIIGQNTEVDYNAGTEINLLENFEVALGSIFSAFIEGCSNNQFQSDNKQEKE